jgi:hypothetical protein
MEPKRRLPLLKSSTDEQEQPDRSPWQWVGFGALAIFVVWLPLAWLTTLAGVRLAEIAQGPAISLARLLVSAAGLAVAALAGGYLVGRWGTAGVGMREAALAGLAAALIALALAWGSGISLGSLIAVAIAVPAAGLGGRLGLRRRR